MRAHAGVAMLVAAAVVLVAAPSVRGEAGATAVSSPSPAPCPSVPAVFANAPRVALPAAIARITPPPVLPTIPPDLPTAPPNLPTLADSSVQAAVAAGNAAAGARASCAGTVPLGSGPLVGFSPAVAAAIEAAAAQYGLNPCLLGAIAMQESSGNPNAIGHDPNGKTVGYGLFQITVGPQPWSPDWANPTVNADKGASMVASAFAAYPNPQQALTYYNCGNKCGNPPNPAYTTITNGLTYPDSVLAKEAQVCPSGQQGAILWQRARPVAVFVAGLRWLRG